MQFYLGWFAPSKCSFNANDFDSHDIAILELENEVKFSNGNDGTQPVSPICLPKSGEVGLSVTLLSCINLNPGVLWRRHWIRLGKGRWTQNR